GLDDAAHHRARHARTGAGAADRGGDGRHADRGAADRLAGGPLRRARGDGRRRALRAAGGGRCGVLPRPPSRPAAAARRRPLAIATPAGAGRARSGARCGRRAGEVVPIAMIRTLQQQSIPAAARLLAGSMADNPLHLAVFGSGAPMEPMLEAAFARLLRRQMRIGIVLGSYEHDALVGVAAMVPPGHCQPGLLEQFAMLPILARSGALQRLPRIRHWLRTWERHDPKFDHWHLGPAAVARTHQGQGIGTRLMREVCEGLDRHQGVGYLETDKPENVRLYRRGGFEVVAEQPVLGVTNWFMVR